jgi:hypothetical protein
MRLLIAAALLLMMNAPLLADEVQTHPPADARMEFLKSLAGSWSAPAHEGSEGESLFEFRVTAGGTAVEEREFAGSPHEMTTMYYMDGDDLVATHYCMLGNQPRARAVKSKSKSALRFDCDGVPGNAASHDEKHIHGWSIRLTDDGVLHYNAALVENGEVAEEPTFVLTRVKG